MIFSLKRVVDYALLVWMANVRLYLMLKTKFHIRIKLMETSFLKVGWKIRVKCKERYTGVYLNEKLG